MLRSKISNHLFSKWHVLLAAFVEILQEKKFLSNKMDLLDHKLRQMQVMLLNQPPSQCSLAKEPLAVVPFFSVLICHQTQINKLLISTFWYIIIRAPFFCVFVVILNARTHWKRKSSYWKPSCGAWLSFLLLHNQAQKENLCTQTHDDCRGTSALMNIRPSLLKVYGRENLLESSLSRGSTLIAARVWARVHFYHFLQWSTYFVQRKKSILFISCLCFFKSIVSEREFGHLLWH